MSRADLKLVVTIDVEEEGLFTGRYRPGSAPTRNVSRLALLSPLFAALKIRPTLLVTYQVARHGALRDFLARLAGQWGAQIGAHLHPWNTPPLDHPALAEPLCSERIAPALLAAKLSTLTRTVAMMGQAPTCFRMGRFNMGTRMLGLLPAQGYGIDTSVAPGKTAKAGPDHLLAPTDPYRPDPKDICRPGPAAILEVPLTIVPVVRGVGAWLRALEKKAPAKGPRVSAVLQRLLLLPAQPAWTGLNRLKAAVRLHRQRGGQVVTVFFHSSELLPGAYPGHPDKAAVRRFLERMDRFFTWLCRDLGARPLTLADLGQAYAPGPAPAGIVGHRHGLPPAWPTMADRGGVR